MGKSRPGQRSTIYSRAMDRGVNVEEAVKDFLNNRAAQIELRKTIERLKKVVERNVKASKKGFALRAVREDRRAAH